MSDRSERQLSPYWKPIPVECFAPECVGCGCNIYVEGQAEYIGFCADGLDADMDEWGRCPKCKWPLNEFEEEMQRDSLEEDGVPAQNMPLPEMVAEYRLYLDRIHKANVERSKALKYGVKVKTYGE